MVRTFIAIDMPTEMHTLFAQIQERLRELDLKLVDPALVHITMKFLGEVPDSRLKAIIKALDRVLCTPFDISVTGLGVFPKPENAKVIWLGCSGELGPLHSRIEEALLPLGFAADEHTFIPHATLARVRSLSESDEKRLKGLLLELQDTRYTFRVDTFRLKKSILGPRGPVYETLREFRLK